MADCAPASSCHPEALKPATPPGQGTAGVLTTQPARTQRRRPAHRADDRDRRTATRVPDRHHRLPRLRRPIAMNRRYHRAHGDPHDPASRVQSRAHPAAGHRAATSPPPVPTSRSPADILRRQPRKTVADQDAEVVAKTARAQPDHWASPVRLSANPRLETLAGSDLFHSSVTSTLRGGRRSRCAGATRSMCARQLLPSASIATASTTGARAPRDVASSALLRSPPADTTLVPRGRRSTSSGGGRGVPSAWMV